MKSKQPYPNMQNFNEQKALNVVLYIAKALKSATLHETFKILYWADMDHLATYGKSIVRDQYIKMTDGPVPSAVYDLIKDLRDKRKPDEDLEHIAKYFQVIGQATIRPVGEVDLDYFSASELKSLDSSIQQNRSLNYGQRVEKSHGPAWSAASDNGKIDPSEIAKEAGASEEMMKYIKEVEGYKDFKPE